MRENPKETDMSKQAQILWLARDKGYGTGYCLFEGEPVFYGEDYAARENGHYFFLIHCVEFEKLCPALTLEPGQKCKVELTQTDNGIRLERIK